MAQDIAGIDRNQRGTKIYDLSAYQSDIIPAVNFLMSGI
jgi:hypothetical protein